MLRSLTRATPLRASSLLFPTAQRSLLASRRLASTERITCDDEQTILVEQRKNRPMSPHLQIYQPQLTWYLSGLHRITGVGLAFGLYAGLVGYVGLPMLGYPFTFADIAEVWGTAPALVKVAAKSIISFPFTFHSFNGLRHLIWDTGRELTIKGVYRSGYAVLGLSAVSALALALL